MKDKIKIKYSELKKKSKEELLEMKKKFEVHNMNVKNKNTKELKGFNMKEVRKNIARINQILNELK